MNIMAGDGSGGGSENPGEGDESDTTPPTVTVIGGEITSNSIAVSVSATDGESGMASSLTYTYYIKQTIEADTAYVAKATGIAESTYTFTGLTQGTSYDIKVEVTGDNAGNTGTGTLRNQVTEMIPGGEDATVSGAITFGSTTWNGGTASITVNTNTDLTIEYQVGAITEENWTSLASEEAISNLSHGNTVYARLTDGTNHGDYASVTIEDNVNPKAANIQLSGTSIKSGGTITATVTHTDDESGVDITNCRYIWNSSSSKLGTNESSYTEGTFVSNGQQLSKTFSSAGTYYLHVLTKDVAGNKIETVSKAVTVQQVYTWTKYNVDTVYSYLSSPGSWEIDAGYTSYMVNCVNKTDKLGTSYTFNNKTGFNIQYVNVNEAWVCAVGKIKSANWVEMSNGHTAVISIYRYGRMNIECLDNYGWGWFHQVMLDKLEVEPMGGVDARGSYVGTVTSTSSSTYPTNGKQGGYWYVANF